MSAVDSAPPPNVLLVDDTPANLQVLGGMLKEQGCVVRPVPTGKLAIRFAEVDPPDIILLDIMMPEIDGYEVCRRLKNIDRLKDIPVIFISALHETIDKVKAFAAGGVDYISKPFHFEEVQARVNTHLKIRRLQIEQEKQNRQLQDLNDALYKAQSALEAELANAANYVLSLIPPPIRKGDIQTNWVYVPSALLGGDSLGYHWIDGTHFAFYLMDVSGHGVGPALLSVSVLNTLRTQSLPDVDFCCPDQVLSALNLRFRSGDNYGLFFTIWYGVFNQESRLLRYASGGHPPAVLVNKSHPPTDLGATGIPLGFVPDAKYPPAAVQMPPASTVYVFSDGCYEIQKCDGEEWTKQEMLQSLNDGAPGDGSQLQVLYQNAIQIRGEERLDDDFSILGVTFM
jgi:sigma-B regulation protein RsbU (phosphoserine phosphatase)